jgi:hypothetical protein
MSVTIINSLTKIIKRMEWYHNLLTYVSPLINVPVLKRVYILNDLVCLANPKLLNTIMMMKEVVSIFEQVQEYGGVKPVKWDSKPQYIIQNLYFLVIISLIVFDYSAFLFSFVRDVCFAVSLELIISNHWDRIISPLINVPILKRVYILNDLVCLANAKLLNTIITMTETISRRVRRYRRGTCSLGHCFVCPSLIYGFWLPLWYLVAIVLSVLLWFTDSDYPFDTSRTYPWSVVTQIFRDG